MLRWCPIKSDQAVTHFYTDSFLIDMLTLILNIAKIKILYSLHNLLYGNGK